jgi:hypothetical protein
MARYWFHAYTPEAFYKAEDNGFNEVFFYPKKIKKAMSIQKDDIIIGYRTKVCRFWGTLKVSKSPFMKGRDPKIYAGTETIDVWYTTTSEGIKCDKEILTLIGEKNGHALGNFVHREPNLLKNGAKTIELIKKRAQSSYKQTNSHSLLTT